MVVLLGRTGHRVGGGSLSGRLRRGLVRHSGGGFFNGGFRRRFGAGSRHLSLRRGHRHRGRGSRDLCRCGLFRSGAGSRHFRRAFRSGLRGGTLLRLKADGGGLPLHRRRRDGQTRRLGSQQDGGARAAHGQSQRHDKGGNGLPRIAAGVLIGCMIRNRWKFVFHAVCFCLQIKSDVQPPCGPQSPVESGPIQKS